MTFIGPLRSLEATLKKFEPQEIRSNLVRAGLFLAGWELLCREIVEGLRGFYMVGLVAIDPNKPSSYERSVLSLNKSPLEASILWLIESNALSAGQAAQIRALRDYRNEVAHELPKLLVEVGYEVDIVRIQELRDLIAVIGRYWVRSEIDCNEDYAGKDIKYEDIQSGMMLLMEHLVAAAEAG